jgi:hypothetical protein
MVQSAATGGRRVVAFDHIARNDAKAAVEGSGVKMAAGRVRLGQVATPENAPESWR